MMDYQIRLGHHPQPHVNQHRQNSARLKRKTIMKAPATTNANESDCDSGKGKDKLFLSDLCKNEKDAGHHINWKEFHIVWRDENPCRLLVNESLMIEAYQPEPNRIIHSVPLIVFLDDLATDMLLDRNR
jgi:hypothetical protein